MRLQTMKPRNKPLTNEDFKRVREVESSLEDLRYGGHRLRNMAIGFIVTGVIVLVLNFQLLVTGMFDAMSTEAIENNTQFGRVAFVVTIYLVAGLFALVLRYSSWFRKKDEQNRQDVLKRLPQEYKTSWNKYQLLAEEDSIRANTEYNDPLNAR